MQQALVANETQRLYFTARAARRPHDGGRRAAVLLLGARAPDLYAVPALERLFAQEGARTLAIVYEEYGNAFYTGLAPDVAAAAEIGFDVVSSAVLTRTAEDAAAGAFDATALEAHLDAAHAARPDVLVLVCRKPEYEHALFT